MRNVWLRRWVAVIAVLAAIVVGIFLGGSAFAGSSYQIQDFDWNSPVIRTVVP